MTIEQKLFDLYKPTDLAVGRAMELKDESTKNFKVKYRYWTERRQATLADFKEHLGRRVGVGLAPINSKSSCSWGAIDVDDYTGDLQELAVNIYALIPFVRIVRSKSGGMHIYIFFDAYYSAEDVVPELARIAAVLGYSKSEIFPKQTKVQTGDGVPDCGNWLNLPYFGGSSATTYGLGKNGEGIDIEAWISFVESSRITLGFLSEFQPAELEGGLFSDGPPCLQTIWANGVSNNRNISLANALVYLRKKNPEGSLEEKAMELNSKMAEPLSEKEVKRTVKSYENKDYRYGCKTSPLCNFCNATACKKRAYGIDEESSVFKGNRSLTKYNTSPPLWLLDLKTEGGTKRISLSTEQLQNPRLFQRRYMETLNAMPPIPKPNKWLENVNDLLEHSGRQVGRTASGISIVTATY